jgi:hypothetical protein
VTQPPLASQREPAGPGVFPWTVQSSGVAVYSQTSNADVQHVSTASVVLVVVETATLVVVTSAHDAQMVATVPPPVATAPTQAWSAVASTVSRSPLHPVVLSNAVRYFASTFWMHAVSTIVL